MRVPALITGLWLAVCPATEALAEVRLYLPEGLAATGIAGYVLPRFSLKTQVKVVTVPDPGEADVILGAGPEARGRAVFAEAPVAGTAEDAGSNAASGTGAETGAQSEPQADPRAGQGPRTWHMEVRGTDPETARFAGWLTSEIGLATVTAFAPEGRALFGPPGTEAPDEAEALPTGDVSLGETAARRACLRCHVISPETRFYGNAMTPGFPVLRALPDWQARFDSFWALNPHQYFTIVPGVTPPLSEDRPAHIHPITVTPEEVQAITAFVAGLEPADLGAPVAHQ